ncbi:MAG: DUF721 domain-containing protein [Bacteroidaceae bacterium]
MIYKKARDIKSLINEFLRAEGLETPLNEYRIIQAWPEVVGQAISRYTGKLFIKNNILYVQIRSAALRENLSCSRTILAEKLNRYVNAQVINEVRFF